MDEMTRDKPSGAGVNEVPVGAADARRRAVWGLAALLGAMFLGNVDVAHVEEPEAVFALVREFTGQ